MAVQTEKSAEATEMCLIDILARVHCQPRGCATWNRNLHLAMARLHSLLSHQTIPPEFAATVSFYQGYLYDELSEPEHALPFYEDALNSAVPPLWYGPNGLDAMHRPPGYAAYRLGMAYLAAQKLPNALAMLEQALAQGIGGENEIMQTCSAIRTQIRSPTDSNNAQTQSQITRE